MHIFYLHSNKQLTPVTYGKEFLSNLVTKKIVHFLYALHRKCLKGCSLVDSSVNTG